MTPSRPSGAGAASLYCPTCEQGFPGGERCPADGTRLVRLVASVDPFLGRELDGRYTITEKLGQGGMGTVYRGHQHSVGRDVAIKVVTPALVTSPDVIKRFLRECKLASRLSHPNAVGVLDFGQTDDGVFFLVMELVQGRTLDEVVPPGRPLAPERVIRIGVQICDALEGAHGLNIVHRDLKPANVMVLATGRDLVKVLDFGLAKSLSPDSAQSTMTGSGALMGTPAYMPPELAMGQECDARADLYSLGCILFYLAAGRPPFRSDSVHELVMMHASEPAPPLPGPPALAAVVERLLRKEPDARYPTAAAAREALEQALARPTDAAAAAAVAADTAISLGPFPATSAAAADGEAARSFDALRSTPVGGVVPARRTRSESAERLAVLDTHAVTRVQGDGASLVPAGRRSRARSLALVATALGAAAAVVMVVALAGDRGGRAASRHANPGLPAPQASVDAAPAAEVAVEVGASDAGVASDRDAATATRPATVGTRPLRPAGGTAGTASGTSATAATTGGTASSTSGGSAGTSHTTGGTTGTTGGTTAGTGAGTARPGGADEETPPF